MDIHEKMKEGVENKLNIEGSKEKQQQQMEASSSPSHEFSFSVSLQTSFSTTDLSPADDIFFHGHLLPLQLLSNLPVPPRSSTNSIETFALPIRDLLNDKNSNNTNSTRSEKAKSKPFSLLGNLRWRKEYDETKVKHLNKKFGFNFSHVLKRYAKMVWPFLQFRRRRDDLHLHKQSYSFSGNLSFRNKPEMRGRRGEFSAPVSMNSSPSNSGVLLSNTQLPPSANDGTMEELQAAIQAAIAHCKNSIVKEDRFKC